MRFFSVNQPGYHHRRRLKPENTRHKSRCSIAPRTIQSLPSRVFRPQRRTRPIRLRKNRHLRRINRRHPEKLVFTTSIPMLAPQSPPHLPQ